MNVNEQIMNIAELVQVVNSFVFRTILIYTYANLNNGVYQWNSKHTPTLQGMAILVENAIVHHERKPLYLMLV